ncbi:malonate decarboxylase subunit epsilon [Scopulibacillus darangshiensis]|nr:malonate decarboxylase subunit epsilon [Scopulibacillus darangshiensis]
MSTAFLFPGQGSQQPNMLHNLPDHTAVKETLEEACDLLSEDVLLMDTEERLQSTITVQMSLLIAGVAAVRALKAEGVTPDLVAGHSIGAFGAAVCAGVMDFKEALSIVKLRGELMERAFPSGYGMGVVLGLNESRLASIIEKYSSLEDPVYLANINSPDQIVISGAISGIEKVLKSVHSNGARKAKILDVSVPSHCKLLKSVSEELSARLRGVNSKQPAVPYAGNRNARPLRDKTEIIKDLTLSISHPVRWHDATSVLYELGARLFIEMPSGHVLSDLAKSAFPYARTFALSEGSITSAVILYDREKGTNG